MIHCESLAAKEFWPELSGVMDTVIKTVNYMKTYPLKGRLHAELYGEIGAQCHSLLFYCNSHWLSGGNIVAHVYSLRDVALFIEEENLVHAEHSHNEYFASKFAYLSNIFEKFNMLSLSMQVCKRMVLT
jgi:hypothetical protein